MRDKSRKARSTTLNAIIIALSVFASAAYPSAIHGGDADGVPHAWSEAFRPGSAIACLSRANEELPFRIDVALNAECGARDPLAERSGADAAHTDAAPLSQAPDITAPITPLALLGLCLVIAGLTSTATPEAGQRSRSSR